MGWGMRVLVISDTHRKNDLYIALVEKLSPDMVVHCGDVEGSAYTIREAAHAECHIVAGNNDFFDSLADRWAELFPGVPAVPGRYEGGIIFLYVRSAPILFSLRPKLRAMARRLAALPGAPKRVDLRLEIHSR